MQQVAPNAPKPIQGTDPSTPWRSRTPTAMTASTCDMDVNGGRLLALLKHYLATQPGLALIPTRAPQ